MAVTPRYALPLGFQDADVPGQRSSRRASDGREQGRSRRPAGESSRRFPLNSLSATSTVVREASERSRLPEGLPARSLARSFGYATGSSLREHQAVLDDFTEQLATGEISGAEAYLARLGQMAPVARGRVDLPRILPCRTEGGSARPRGILSQVPRASRAAGKALLGPLRMLVVSTGLLDRTVCRGGYLTRGWRRDRPLPAASRARARGFARVFLAEQADLENRLVILKLSTRPTREPWLLARARHSHIVEILSHAERR